MEDKNPRSVELTNESYDRWLRACRPQPISWFLGLHLAEQETLAMQGDRYTEDLFLGFGYAALDPLAAEAGLNAATDLTSEEILARRLANNGSANAVPTVLEPAAPTMSGWSQRKKDRAQATQDAKNESRSLFGKKPDGVEQ